MLALHFHSLIVNYGVGVLFIVTCLESMGAPIPGESALITFALYSGLHPELGIFAVIAAAATGAILGSVIGYEIGRRYGLQLLLRHGRKIRLTARRLKIGQYLFRRYGGWIVFISRFAAVLRTLSALLAGANCMPWRRFFISNVIGGVIWASLYAGGAYVLGRSVHEVVRPVGVAIGILAVVALVSLALVLKQQEARLTQEAERADPGPLHS